jgi:hypothetical protein
MPSGQDGRAELDPGGIGLTGRGLASERGVLGANRKEVGMLVLVIGGIILGLVSPGSALGSGHPSPVSAAASEGSMNADFNGDGYSDLAIGASLEDVGAAAFNAGGVNVIYGSPLGLSATATPDQLWTQDSPNVEDAAESYDAFSTALAGADFNGDGYADLAIGVHGEDLGGLNYAGAVNVIYGSPSGLSATATPDQFWTQDSPNVEDVSEADDHFGWALAAADFGGSSHADLAIGVFGETLGGANAAGAVHVIYGSPSGLSATATPDQFWTQDSPNVSGSAETNDFFGQALAAANFGGSSHADLAIGVEGEALGGLNNAGGVNVIYGSSSGLSATVTPDQFWYQDTTNVEGAAEQDDHFGSALAAADFGGSSHADLAIGVPQEDVGGVRDAGGVNVIYGSSSGLSASATPDQFWYQDSPNVEGSVGEGNVFGHALAAANFGGSSHADLAIGVPGAGLTDAGVAGGWVNVIYGSSSGLSATATPDQLWTQDSPNVEGIAEVYDFFGSALAAANFGGSSHADLAIGVPEEDVAFDNAGGVNVIYGSSSGLSATATPDQFWYQGTVNVEGAAEESDQFGFSLAAVK